MKATFKSKEDLIKFDPLPSCFFPFLVAGLTFKVLAGNEKLGYYQLDIPGKRDTWWNKGLLILED